MSWYYNSLYISNSVRDSFSFSLKWAVAQNLFFHEAISLQNFPVAQTVKNLFAMQETRVRYLGWEEPLVKGKAIHFSILAWRIPWTLKELGGLQSVGLQRVGHDGATNMCARARAHTHTQTHTRAHAHFSPSRGKVSLSQKVFVFLRSFNTFLNSKVRNYVFLLFFKCSCIFLFPFTSTLLCVNFYKLLAWNEALWRLWWAHCLLLCLIL